MRSLRHKSAIRKVVNLRRLEKIRAGTQRLEVRVAQMQPRSKRHDGPLAIRGKGQPGTMFGPIAQNFASRDVPAEHPGTVLHV